jgi:threonine dehydratase
MGSHRLSLELIERASQVIDPIFLNTSQFFCEPLSQALGVQLAIKIETLNPVRCFKGRGADFLVSQFQEKTPIVCASAGNFGQAIAYACRKHRIPLTVYAGVTANPLKIERMQALGAKVILQGEDFDAAKQAAREAATQHHHRFVEDGLEIETLAGAGTMGLEWLQFPEALDVLLIPLGNGAMLNGVARVLKAHRPQTQIVAVQAAGASAMTESWRSGQVVIHKQMQTIADGIGVRVPIPEALQDMEGLVDDALLVQEDNILKGMQLLHSHAGIVPEPSAAVGVAVILENPTQFQGKRVGTIICGGNLTKQRVKDWLL